MSTRPHLAKSLLWLTIAEILFNLSGYIIQSVAGRVLGPADYGRYSLVITLTTVVVVLIGNGIPTAMSRYLSESFESNARLTLAIKRQGIRLQMLLMGLVTLAFFLLSPVIAWALGDATLTPLFRFSSLIIPAFAASSFYFSYFTGLHRFKTQAMLKMFRSLMRIIVTVSFIIFFGLQGAIAGYILAPLFTFCLGLYFDWKLSQELFSAENTSADSTSPEELFPWQKLLQYAWPITLFMLFYELFISIDLYLIKNILASDQAAGYYNAALTLGRIPYYLFYALSIILLPALAKMNAEADREKMSALLTASLRYAGIILLPVFVLLATYAKASLALVFGSRYIGPETVVSLQALALGLSCLTVFYLLATALSGIGRARTAMWLTLIGFTLNTLLNWFFLHAFNNIVGAAAATTASSFFLAGITLYITLRIIPYALNFLAIAKTLLVTGVLWYAAIHFPATDWRFIPYSLLLTLGYFIALYLVRVIYPSDLAHFKKIFKKGT
jgi:O-antigen/teichoic acid export membrane protein